MRLVSLQRRGRTINLVDLVMLSNGRDMGSWMDLAAPG